MSSSNPFDNVGNDQFLDSYGSNENNYVDDEDEFSSDGEDPAGDS